MASDGSDCNDSNECTRTDWCLGGICTGLDPVQCVASDQCHLAGTCAPATGQCSNPVAPNGTACTDGNVCTQADTCQNGTCSGLPVPPPTEVNSSVAVAESGLMATISWSDGPGPFAVYRGLRAGTGAWAYNQTCRNSGVPGPVTDGGMPGVGNTYYYLVSRKTVCGESIIGRDSGGTIDPNTSPCP